MDLHPFHILYLAPWVDYGGSDKGTIDWFRWLDRDRFRASLITTQPSPNRRLAEVEPFAHEVWSLPDLLRGEQFPAFIFDFLKTRRVRVLHIMNARLAFELLPDLASLPRPPKVVIQLHVEEQDRSGYVRYVTTRYGNLVDAFSVTSDHLAASVEDYDVPRSKIHVIHTGVDSQEEFSPERVQPRRGFDPRAVHILYPGRLTAQKDPLLMVKVAERLRAHGTAFQVHVVGDGDLTDVVRQEIRRRNLETHVQLHPPTRDLAPWYRACDMLLMTSVFEGVPYVLYEAMAMALPVVVPALPGNVELLRHGGGQLIEPRDDEDAYLSALTALSEAPDLRARIGDEGRRTAAKRFSVQEMARRHEALYQELASEDPAGLGELDDAVPRPAPIRFRGRSSRDRPPVTVLVPCFNHGRYLEACLETVRAQTYEAIETIVVDDGSTDGQTLEALDRVTKRANVEVIRLAENRGPSAARNAGLDIAQGRYVLPLDADNLLLPDAVTELVAQISVAGELVGFVYPNLQHFGNRDDFFRAPDYNLHTLLRGNYCDTSSLFDREIFDAGLRFADDIRLGHEDWDFALTLAEHEIYGEPAKAKTLLFRKQGFTRSDAVEHAPQAFHELVKDRHRPLYGATVHLPPRAAVKSRWAPALTVITLTPVEPEHEAARALAHNLGQQTCLDVELIVRSHGEWRPGRDGPPIRRIPAALARSPTEALSEAFRMVRGQSVLICADNARGFLEDPGAVEKLLRSLAANPELDAIAFVERDPLEDAAWSLHTAGDTPDPLAVAVRALPQPEHTPPFSCGPGAEVASIVRGLIATGRVVQWRRGPTWGRREDVDADTAQAGAREVSIAAPLTSRPSAREELNLRHDMPPALPSLAPGHIRRWAEAPSWMPPHGSLLCRHREIGSERRIVTTSRQPPPGHYLEHDLGVARQFAVPGTARLVQGSDGSYRRTPTGPDNPSRPGDVVLGHVELYGFPLVQALDLTRHPETGQAVLVAGADDPLNGAVEHVERLGFVEPFPLEPRRLATAERSYGLIGLVRSVDRGARRHRYGLGAKPAGEPVGELGAVLDTAQRGAVATWVTTEGLLVTDDYRPLLPDPSVKTATRWVLAPAARRGYGHAPDRMRAVIRRALVAPRHLASRSSPVGVPNRAPDGYLLGRGLGRHGPRTAPLYAATHPVTGDQLLTTNEEEPAELGYVATTFLGCLIRQAPVTGSLGMQFRRGVPWASRFGLTSTWG